VLEKFFCGGCSTFQFAFWALLLFLYDVSGAAIHTTIRGLTPSPEILKGIEPRALTIVLCAALLLLVSAVCCECFKYVIGAT